MDIDNNKENTPSAGKKEKKRHLFGKGFSIGLMTGIAGMSAAFAIVISTGSGMLSPKAYFKAKRLSSIIDKYYYKNVSVSKKRDGLYKGIIESTGDKYSEYYTPEEFSEMEIDLTGDYAGIGIAVSTRESDKAMEIATVYKDSPAEKSGIKKGDVIVAVDGKKISDMKLDDAVKLVRGEPGTKVSLTLKRDSSEYTRDVVRKKINIPTVDYKMLDDGIGYINISQFADGTADEFEKAIKDLQSQGMKAVIYDVRFNGGGLVESVTKVLDDILPAGTVVYMKDKYGRKTDFKSDDKKSLHIPTVVLTSGNTASAAEIFTGAIRDFHYGKIIGTKTFGKGIVQTTMPLGDGSAVKITTDTYYTPSGDAIHKKGIKPDIKLKYKFLGNKDQDYDVTLDNQIQKGAEVLKSEL